VEPSQYADSLDEDAEGEENLKGGSDDATVAIYRWRSGDGAIQ
jgi:hypothetical protein